MARAIRKPRIVPAILERFVALGRTLNFADSMAQGVRGGCRMAKPEVGRLNHGSAFCPPAMPHSDVIASRYPGIIPRESVQLGTALVILAGPR